MGGSSSKSADFPDDTPRCMSRADTGENRTKVVRRMAEQQDPGPFSQEEWEDLKELEESTRQEAPSDEEPVDVHECEFPFENLIFDGGSSKSPAYIGALKCCQDFGIRAQMKRVAGSGCGAVFAALVALGYTPDEIQDALGPTWDQIFVDNSWGYLSLLPNLVRSFGWNPGQRAYEWLGDKIEAKTGKPDYTFLQLYEDKGIELCVLVTNVNRNLPEYLHPKTRPDMPIRNALRMTMSIPCVYSAVSQRNQDVIDSYVDGGLAHHYPINCFDGWYLSMAKEDRFLDKMSRLSELVTSRGTLGERFKGHNNKTLGFITYDVTQSEEVRQQFLSRVGKVSPPHPGHPTPVYKSYLRRIEGEKSVELEHKKLTVAFQAFLEVLKSKNMSESEQIDKGQLMDALQDNEKFPKKYYHILFGAEVKLTEVLNLLDNSGDGLISTNELTQFIETKSRCMQSRYLSYSRRIINGFMDFLSTLQNNTLNYLKFALIKESDLDRTVPIDVDYITGAGISVERDDVEFMIMRGYACMVGFLKDFVKRHPDLITRNPELSTAAILKANAEANAAAIAAEREKNPEFMAGRVDGEAEGDVGNMAASAEEEHSKLIAETGTHP